MDAHLYRTFWSKDEGADDEASSEIDSSENLSLDARCVLFIFIY